MKKFKSISLLATLIVLIVVAIIGVYIYISSDSYQAKQLYEALGDDYTVSQCDTIIEKFLNSDYAELAKQKKNDLIRQQNEWAYISNKPTLERLTRFKSRYTLSQKMTNAVVEKIDSIIWENALRGRTQKHYEEYIALGEMTRHYDEALIRLQNMYNLPNVQPLESELKINIDRFYDALSERSKTHELINLCADTITRFLFRHNITKEKLSSYILNNYNKKNKKRIFNITSDIEFTKAYISDGKVGYAALFEIEQGLTSKPIIKKRAMLIFTPEGKVAYMNMRRVYKKL